MGLEFLARVRSSSLWAGATAALMVATYVTAVDGAALALGTAWSLVNLALIQRLVVAVTGPGRGEPPALRGAALSVAGMSGLFAAGALLLAQLPPASLAWGFLVPFAVIVLKAASLILLGSRPWKRWTRGASRTAGGFTVLLLAACVAIPLLAGAGPTPGHEPAAQPGAAAEPGAPADGAAHPTREAHGTERGASQGPEKFANFVTVLARAFPQAPWAHFLHEFEAVLFAFLVGGLLVLVTWLAGRNAQLVPGRFQNAVEYLVEALHRFIVGILGEKHGPRYVPFLGTLFLYIWCMNLFGLIPFMDSPTSSLDITVALAVTVFLYAQWIGFQQLGPIGYLDHLAGNPRTAIQWGLVPLMLPIHVLGEFAKPISLAARLFGNVFGEDMLLVAFASIGVMSLAFSGLPVGLPLQVPFLGLALLTGTLQALVFTVLSTIYFLLMLPHDDHPPHEPAATAH